MARSKAKRKNVHRLANDTEDGIIATIDFGNRYGHIRRQLFNKADRYRSLINRRRLDEAKELWEEFCELAKHFRNLVHADALDRKIQFSQEKELLASLDDFFTTHLGAKEARRLKLEITGDEGGPIRTMAELNPEDRKLLQEASKLDVKRQITHAGSSN